MYQFTDRHSSETYFFNTCFDKNQLKNLISWFITHNGEKKTVDILETLKQVGFHQATLAGVSLGVDDLQIPSQKSFFMSQAKSEVSLFQQQNSSGNLTSVEKSQRMISTWNQTSEFLRKTAVQNFKTTNQLNPVYMMAFSGARGNISQVRQLVAMRGLMADPQGAIVEFPIQSNFREGLTLTEYLISCFGARKGLVDTALRTATSGYLTRRLVDAAQHVVVSLRDCGTKEGYRLKNKNLEPHLIGRVLSKNLVIDSKLSLQRNQIISPTLAKIISKNTKEVFVRSPLTCQAENSICQFCYGWNLAHGKLVNLGDAVGVLAAQSIGEPGTQLTMRTFHTGGVGVFSDQAMKYFRAPYDGILQYSEGLPGHFVRTPHGKIVYMLRTSSLSKNSSFLRTTTPVLKIKSEGLKIVEFFLKKQDLPAGSILLVRQGEKVKSGQVIAQVPLIKQSKQKMPESTYPVFSPLEGEVGFESLLVLEQKKLPDKIQKRVQKQSKKDEKTLGPLFRTINGVGAFWVFSSQNQKEFHCGKTFLRPGDLVSTKTQLFQYDFYVLLRSIFHTIENKLCLGLHAVYLPVKKIHFHKRTYSFVLKNTSFQKNKFFPKSQALWKKSEKKEFFFFTKRKLGYSLIWFPTRSLLAASGYFFNSRFYSERQSQKMLNLSHSKNFSFLNENIKNKKNISTSKTEALFQKAKLSGMKSSSLGNLFYQSKPIKKWKKNKLSISNEKLFFQFQQIAPYFILNLASQNARKQHYLVQVVQKTALWQKNTKSKIKFCSSLHEKYLLQPTKTRDSDFLQQALQNIKPLNSSNLRVDLNLKNLSKISQSSKSLDFCSLIHEKQGWLFVPSTFQEASLFGKEKSPFLSKEKQSFSFSNRRKPFNFLTWEQGKPFNNFLFGNCKISIESISVNEIKIIKSFFKNKNKFLEKKKNYLDDSQNNWYSKNCFLNQYFLVNPQQKNTLNRFSFSDIFFNQVKKDTTKQDTLQHQPNCYLYYKLQKQTREPNSLIMRSVRKNTNLNFQKKLPCFFFISKLNEFYWPKKRDLIRQWNNLKILNSSVLERGRSSSLKKSPFVIKQEGTFFKNQKKSLKNFTFLIAESQGWFSQKNFYKFLMKLNSPTIYKKVNESFLISKQIKTHKIPLTGLQLFRYDFLSFQENTAFDFELFDNKWILPGKKLLTSYIPVTKSGEFRYLKYKENETIACILTKQNLRTVDVSKFIPPALDGNLSQKNNVNSKNVPLFERTQKTQFIPESETFWKEKNQNVPSFEQSSFRNGEYYPLKLKNTLTKNNKVKVGALVRSGTEVFSGIASLDGGLILTKTLTTYTLRCGIPFLASSRGVCHIFDQDLVQKNDLLVTLKSKRFQTEDIVQGIPKIEQLFEVRESQGGIRIQNSAHTRLQNYFLSSLKSKNILATTYHTLLEQAVTRSLKKIQLFLVQSIFEAYASQGVQISQKHIEIIVRQMTRRVRVVDGGESGLLSGELLPFTRIQKLNHQLFLLKKHTVLYEPVLLGITKSVLQSESFLVAASFQEVSRVLVRSALARKTDFLRGLHENVILGQVIPTGTGLVPKAPLCAPVSLQKANIFEKSGKRLIQSKEINLNSNKITNPDT